MKSVFTKFSLLIILLTVAFFYQPATAQQNILTNPSFERPYTNGSAQGWYPWHEDTGKGANCDSRYVVLPSWAEESNPALVLDGSISQHIGNQFDTWHAGVMQDVTVTPGTTYRLTVSARGRGSNQQYPTPSDTGLNMGVRVGIDPNGSGLWNDGDIVWGASGSAHDNWQQFTTEATATNNKITVFVSSDWGGSNQCRAHLDTWFDNAQLISVSASPVATTIPGSTVSTPSAPAVPPTAPPPPVVFIPTGPTATPNAEGIIYSTVQSGDTMWGVAARAGITLDELLSFNNLSRSDFVRAGQQLIVGYGDPPTPVPTAAPTDENTSGGTGSLGGGGDALPTPLPATATAAPTGGTICLNSFADNNGNGQRDADEGFMAGITLIVAQDDGIVAQGTSSGTDQALCFDQLPTGSYDVAQQLGTTIETTTASNVNLSISEGQSIAVEFGSRFKSQTVADTNTQNPEATAVNTTDGTLTTPDDGGFLSKISGLLVLIAAIGILGALIAMVIRNQKS